MSRSLLVCQPILSLLLLVGAGLYSERVFSQDASKCEELILGGLNPNSQAYLGLLEEALRRGQFRREDLIEIAASSTAIFPKKIENSIVGLSLREGFKLLLNEPEKLRWPLIQSSIRHLLSSGEQRVSQEETLSLELAPLRPRLLRTLKYQELIEKYPDHPLAKEHQQIKSTQVAFDLLVQTLESTKGRQKRINSEDLNPTLGPSLFYSSDGRPFLAVGLDWSTFLVFDIQTKKVVAKWKGKRPWAWFKHISQKNGRDLIVLKSEDHVISAFDISQPNNRIEIARPTEADYGKFHWPDSVYHIGTLRGHDLLVIHWRGPYDKLTAINLRRPKHHVRLDPGSGSGIQHFDTLITRSGKTYLLVQSRTSVRYPVIGIRLFDTDDPKLPRVFGIALSGNQDWSLWVDSRSRREYLVLSGENGVNKFDLTRLKDPYFESNRNGLIVRQKNGSERAYEFNTHLQFTSADNREVIAAPASHDSLALVGLADHPRVVNIKLPIAGNSYLVKLMHIQTLGGRDLLVAVLSDYKLLMVDVKLPNMVASISLPKMRGDIFFLEPVRDSDGRDLIAYHVRDEKQENDSIELAVFSLFSKDEGEWRE